MAQFDLQAVLKDVKEFVIKGAQPHAETIVFRDVNRIFLQIEDSVRKGSVFAVAFFQFWVLMRDEFHFDGMSADFEFKILL